MQFMILFSRHPDRADTADLSKPRLAHEIAGSLDVVARVVVGRRAP
jgi:hypothetical protein